MTSSTMLVMLLEREESARDAARVEADAAHRGAADAHKQADDLVAYRAEYMKRWADRFATASSIEILRCYRSFVDRIDQAITQQQHAAVRAQAASDAARNKLLVQQRQVASVQRLIERRLAGEREVAQRREQKQVDEAAQRALQHRAREQAPAPESRFSTALF
jgi:flagellar protein FliJ